MNKKGIKTTVASIVILLLGVTMFVLFFLGKLDTQELTLGLAGLGSFGTIMIGFLSKDVTGTHSVQRRGTVDPDPIGSPNDSRGR